MKRLRRWLFNGIVGLSLLFFAGAVAVAVRCHYYADNIYVGGDSRNNYYFSTGIEPNVIYFLKAYPSLYPDKFKWDSWQQGWAPISYPPETWHGFSFKVSGQGQSKLYATYFPSWVPVTFFGLLPAYWLFAKIRNRHIVRDGFCASCGYDLRATPDQCPECGKIVEKII